jgi:hypothetical protein
MELCILKFKSANKAGRAVTKSVRQHGDRNPWLHEMGVVKRPLIGRISIRATYPNSDEVREGDLASKLAKVGKWMGYLIGSRAGLLRALVAGFGFKHAISPTAKRLEDQRLGIGDIKDFLPRGSSALMLIASEEICGRMVESFAPWHPEVIRRDVSPGVGRLLEQVHRRAERAIDSTPR